MRILLDTHAFLWFVMSSPELSPRARALIEDPENDLGLSVASAWEIAIKLSLGKLRLDDKIDTLIVRELESNALTWLCIELPELARVAELPFHHRDPFDRLLAAQCLTQNMPILSRDAAFDAYGVERLW